MENEGGSKHACLCQVSVMEDQGKKTIVWPLIYDFQSNYNYFATTEKKMRSKALCSTFPPIIFTRVLFRNCHAARKVDCLFRSWYALLNLLIMLFYMDLALSRRVWEKTFSMLRFFSWLRKHGFVFNFVAELFSESKEPQFKLKYFLDIFSWEVHIVV